MDEVCASVTLLKICGIRWSNSIHSQNSVKEPSSLNHWGISMNNNRNDRLKQREEAERKRRPVERREGERRQSDYVPDTMPYIPDTSSPDCGDTGGGDAGGCDGGGGGD